MFSSRYFNGHISENHYGLLTVDHHYFSQHRKTSGVKWGESRRSVSYLEVHRLHLVFQRVRLAHDVQDGGHLVRVVEVLHHGVDGVHDAPRVLSQLAALLHLLRVVHVLELAEVLLGRGEVHKEPGGESRAHE